MNTVKQRIIELVLPDVKRNGYKLLRFTDKWEPYSIQLHDVLRAMWKSCGHVMWVYMRHDGVFGLLEQDDEYHNFRKDAWVRWNLTLDYDGQTPEVQEFIGKLLGLQPEAI